MKTVTYTFILLWAVFTTFAYGKETTNDMFSVVADFFAEQYILYNQESIIMDNIKFAESLIRKEELRYKLDVTREKLRAHDKKYLGALKNFTEKADTCELEKAVLILIKNRYPAVYPKAKERGIFVDTCGRTGEKDKFDKEICEGNKTLLDNLGNKQDDLSISLRERAQKGISIFCQKKD